jgi:hypothetical protein
MAFDLTDVRCTQCDEHKPDRVGLSLPATDKRDVLDIGFCSEACFCVWVRDEFIDKTTRAAAAPSSVAGPPSAAGGGTGSAQGRSPGSAAVQASPISRPPHGALALDRKSSIAGREGRAVSVPPVRVRPASFAEAEATIQRLIAQADAYGRRVAEMEDQLAAEAVAGEAAAEIVERIMTQHWDMGACPCWVCVAGREAGCRARGTYLDEKRPAVDVAR